MKPLILVLFLSLGLFACQDQATTSTPDTPPPAPTVELSDRPFVRDIEVAHEKGAWLSHEMVAFDLKLTFGGRVRFDGTVSMATNTGRLRLDENEMELIFEGENVYQFPDSLEKPGARFDIFTWTDFFALPYKLDDPGTIWNSSPHNTLNGTTYDSEKLTFEDGTGDSSLDWYIVYADQKDHRVHAAAYIVTMYASQEEAEVDPHAIVYEDYRMVEGIPIAHQWTFWGWREAEGLTEQLGSAEVSNVQFGDLEAEKFQAGPDWKRVDYVRPEAE